MAIVYRATSMFQVTTSPTDPRWAVAHTGGWSESFWTQNDPLAGAANEAWNSLEDARATMLPATASIIGWRVQKYDIQQNRLVPQGSRIGTRTKPGRIAIVTDIPQAAIQLIAATAGPNKSNVILRCIPDDYIKGGEFAPDPVYLRFFTTWRNLLIGSQFGFCGRDMTQASTQVIGISVDGVVTVSGIPSTGLVANDFVRFNRCINTLGELITGTYQVGVVTGNTFTLRGARFPGVVTKPNGTLRRDMIGFYSYTQTFMRRATTRKVGSPFEKYRGRRSKRRRVS